MRRKVLNGINMQAKNSKVLSLKISGTLFTANKIFIKSSFSLLGLISLYFALIDLLTYLLN